MGRLALRQGSSRRGVTRTTLIALALVVSLTWSQAATGLAQDPTPPPPPPVPTVQPEEESTLGLTRQAPAEPGEEVISRGLGVTILESIQGDVARDRLIERDANNPEPTEGQEYVLVRVKVRNVKRGNAPILVTGANFGLTASAARLYPAATVVPLEPELRGEVYPTGALEGWVALTVFVGETNRELVLLPGVGADPTTFRYMAIDVGATMASDGSGIVDPAGFAPVALPGSGKNDVGMSPEAPAGVDTAISTESIAVQVVEVVRGEEAATQLATADAFNPRPLPQNENILVKVRVSSLGPGEGPITVSSFDFSIIGAGNIRYSQTGLVAPSPVLEGRIYPGGTIEGFLAFEIQRNDANLLLVYQPIGQTNAEPRYLALTPTATAAETPPA